MEPLNVASILLVHSRESRRNLKDNPAKSLPYALELARNLALWEMEVKYKN